MQQVGKQESSNGGNGGEERKKQQGTNNSNNGGNFFNNSINMFPRSDKNNYVDAVARDDDDWVVISGL